MTMHFSKIYIQDNFVPDYSTDPYRRKVIGVEVFLNEGEDLNEAKVAAENYIKEYIHANKIESPHIIERYIPEEQLPVMQKERNSGENLSLEEQINNCTEMFGPNGLVSYRVLAEMNPKLMEKYTSKFKQLQP